MNTVEIPAVSREYLYVADIKAFRNGAEADPTVLPVRFAFVKPEARPKDSDFSAGEWEPDATEPTARVLLGPTALVLARGPYDVWLRVEGAIERPTRPVGQIVIT